MMEPHTALGIAQTIFYVPMVPLAIWLFKRNGKIRPRMAWWPLVPFTLMRLAGGPIIIAMEKDRENIGLFIAALILLNVGVIPLIVADLGMTRIILLDNFGDGPFTHRITVALRLTFVGAVALLGAGGGIGGVDDAGMRHTGHILTLVGYIVFAAELAVLTAMQVYYFTRKSSLVPSGHKVLRGTLLAAPFIAVRTVYGILEVATSNDPISKWNPVTGSTVTFAFMALAMEYIALCIYLFTGYSIPPGRDLPARSSDTEAGKLTSTNN